MELRKINSAKWELTTLTSLKIYIVFDKQFNLPLQPKTVVLVFHLR